MSEENNTQEELEAKKKAEAKAKKKAEAKGPEVRKNFTDAGVLYRKGGAYIVGSGDTKRSGELKAKGFVK